MCCASAKTGRTRIQYAALVGEVVGIAGLLHRVCMMAHKEVPAKGGIFRSESMERRYIVVRRQTWTVGTTWVAAGLQDKNLSPMFRQPSRQGAAAGARSNDDVVEV